MRRVEEDKEGILRGNTHGRDEKDIRRKGTMKERTYMWLVLPRTSTTPPVKEERFLGSRELR